MPESRENFENAPQTIFFKNIESYSGSKIGEFFSRQYVNSTLPQPETQHEQTDEEDEITGNESVQSTQAGQSLSGHKETGPTYTVFGATKNMQAEKPDWLSLLIKYESHEELLERVLECDVIVCDITSENESIEESLWLANALQAEMENFDTPKTFILISTVLTWAKTLPLDLEDSTLPFTEDEFRRRKPHRNFEDHLQAEKNILKLGLTNPLKFQTFVVASGLTYGCGENMFHFFFKNAWLGDSASLQCFGSGQNTIPAIHVHDLASILQNVCERKPRVKYILATDESHNTLKDIVESLCVHLGSSKMRMFQAEDYDYMHDGVSSTLSVGGVEYISWEDALLIKELKQCEFDSLLVDLRMEPSVIQDQMSVDWKCREGLVAHMQMITEEFRQTRQLLPMRVCVLGAPASGKTELAKKLCEYYKLHHIRMSDVLREAEEKLEQSTSNIEQGSSVAEEFDDEGGKMEEMSLLRMIRESQEEGGDKLDDRAIARIFRKKLKSTPCMNQGYVLDGFPKSLNQAQLLFAAEEEDADDGRIDEHIFPEVVISLTAKDQSALKKSLFERIMNLDEALVQDTHNNEEGFLRRWDDFQMNSDEITSYMNDGRHECMKEIDVLKTQTIPDMLDCAISWLKEPRNYGETEEEKEAKERAAAEERIERETREREEKERVEAEEIHLIKHRKEEWMARLDGLRTQELDDLETESIPMRKYMMDHVMPTLTKGLIECVRERPDNPLDYLAEYIFKNNPDV